jgi:hypothetical protein
VKFNPPTVKVRLPAPVLNMAIVEHRLFASVDLTPNHPDLLEARDKGKTSVTIKDLPLTLAINSKHAKLVDVKSVTAEVSFKAQSERVLPFITVLPVPTPEVSNDYVILFEPTLKNLPVIGPEDQLEKLLDPSVKLLPAVFFVSADDAKDALTRGEAGKSATVYFNFPDGVKVKRAPGEPPPSITYKVKRRGA